jgi:hypothetical protein
MSDQAAQNVSPRLVPGADVPRFVGLIGWHRPILPHGPTPSRHRDDRQR